MYNINDIFIIQMDGERKKKKTKLVAMQPANNISQPDFIDGLIRAKWAEIELGFFWNINTITSPLSRNLSIYKISLIK